MSALCAYPKHFGDNLMPEQLFLSCTRNSSLTDTWRWGRITQLVECQTEKPGAILTQALFSGAATDFPPSQLSVQTLSQCVSANRYVILSVPTKLAQLSYLIWSFHDTVLLSCHIFKHQPIYDLCHFMNQICCCLCIPLVDSVLYARVLFSKQIGQTLLHLY